MNTTGKGSAGELRVARYLEDRGWTVGLRRHRRFGGDWLAVKPDGTTRVRDRLVTIYRVRLIEVKTDKANPWANFRPAARAELLEAAKGAQADALLAWTPNVKTIRLIPPSDWP